MENSIHRDFMIKKKVNTARKLLREGGFRAIANYGKIKLKARKSSIRLDNSRFGLDGIDDEAKMAMLTNGYELQERLAITRYLRRDLPVVELGGSIGVVACLTNKLLKDRKAHVVVEANPFAIPHLERNKQRNRCAFEIVNRAIAYRTDTVTFRPSSKMCGNSITSEGDQPPVTVPTVQLGELVRSHGFERFTLVCDIEGLECDLVANEADVLRNADTIIMETHARLMGARRNDSMMERLQELGFTMLEETGFVVVLRQ